MNGGSGDEVDESTRASHRAGDRLRRAYTFLLGTAAAGMFFNLLSASLSYRGIAAVALIGALMALIGWLRRLPRRAPLVRAAIPGLLGTALVVTVAGMARSSWSIPSTVIALTALTVAVALSASVEGALKLLTSVTEWGFGVVCIGVGITLLPASVVGGAGVAAMGVAAVGREVAVSRDIESLRWAMYFPVGAAFIGMGLALSSRSFAGGVASVVVGIACIVFGVAGLRHTLTLMRVTLVVLLIAGLGGCVVVLLVDGAGSNL